MMSPKAAYNALASAVDKATPELVQASDKLRQCIEKFERTKVKDETREILLTYALARAGLRIEYETCRKCEGYGCTHCSDVGHTRAEILK